MNQELDNLNPISIDDIKKCIKNAIPDEFDKMIISSDATINRADYFYVKHKSVFITREGKIVNFPLYGAIKDNFAEIEGGEQKHGERAILSSEKFLDYLSTNHNIEADDYDIESIKDPNEFPIEAESNEVLSTQKKYFFPDQTFQQQCSECNGEKYITCTDVDCQGNHEWVCPDCNGDRKLTCDVCGGDRKVNCDECGGDGKITCKDCRGAGSVKCGGGVGNFAKRGLIGNIGGGGCNGTGYVKDGDDERVCKTCRGSGEVVCKTCGSKGEIRCEICNGRGEVNCANCNAQGTIPCGTCDATGKIVCEECYGDKDKYGMIDCPNCDTQGTTAQVVYIETVKHENLIEKLFHLGAELSMVDEDNLMSNHSNSNAKTTTTMININDTYEENYDDQNRHYGGLIINELGYEKDAFPKITNEEIYYQIIPCIQVEYRHMLTNQLHEVSIINYFKNPEVILREGTEVIKKDLGNATKSVSGLFGKIFKTKKHKAKEDKKNEIILMIYLARADGKIDEEEKIYISQLIANLDEFTAKEKQYIFDTMNISELPELTIKQTRFSSKMKADEVVEKLEQLAQSDGEYDSQEKEFIEKVKSMVAHK